MLFVDAGQREGLSQVPCTGEGPTLLFRNFNLKFKMQTGQRRALEFNSMLHLQPYLELLL